MDTLAIISTTSLTILTAIYVWLTYKLSKTNSIMLEEQLRPYVVPKVYIKGVTLYFELENIGKRPAYNVSVKVIPEFDLMIEKIFDYQQLLSQKYMFPGFSIKNILSFSMDYFELKEKNPEINEYRIEVTYFDINNRNYSEAVDINLDQLIIGESPAEYDNTYYLKNISESLQMIKESFNKIKKI